MRTFLAYFFSFIFLACGCAKKEEVLEEAPIVLSSYSVHFLAGEECVIDVSSETKNLAIVEMNSDVASAWWINSGKSILIKGEDVGNTSVIVKDVNIVDRTVAIEVTSDYFEGDFIEKERKPIF